MLRSQGRVQNGKGWMINDSFKYSCVTCTMIQLYEYIYIYILLKNIYYILILLNFRLKETTPSCQPLILDARHLRDVSQLMLAFDSFP